MQQKLFLTGASSYERFELLSNGQYARIELDPIVSSGSCPVGYGKMFNGIESVACFKVKGDINERVVFPITEDETELYINKHGVKLEKDEVLCRFSTPASDIFGMALLIKINIKKWLVYFMDDATVQSLEGIVFEKRGCKIKWINAWG